MTPREAAIVTAYTTYLCGSFDSLHGGLSLAIFAAVSIADKYKEFMKEEEQ